MKKLCEYAENELGIILSDKQRIYKEHPAFLLAEKPVFLYHGVSGSLIRAIMRRVKRGESL